MNSEILIYQNPDGNIKIDVRLQEETVWLTQAQMGQLFGKDKRTISEHISNIFSEGELDKNSTVRKFRTVQTEGNREVERELDHFNLDVIISVGYRVKSVQGTQFRIWATQRLKEYIIKGFTLNDDRFKSGSSMNYFNELQDRIREIRLSEKFFYQFLCEQKKEFVLSKQLLRSGTSVGAMIREAEHAETKNNFKFINIFSKTLTEFPQ